MSGEVTSGEQRLRLGVVLCCHDAYLGFLKEAVASIEAQTIQFDRKILVYDGDTPPTMAWDWVVVTHKSGRPNRNIGLQYLDTEWVVHFDADNIMSYTYVEALRRTIPKAPRSCALIYPPLEYFGGTPRKLNPPEWNYWDQRNKFYIDNSAAWRLDAVKSVGGWMPTLQEDYNTAIRLTEAGWTAMRLPTQVQFGSLQGPADVCIRMREHNLGRITDKPIEDHIAAAWNHRSLGIVVTVQDESTLSYWKQAVAHLELPSRTSLYVTTVGFPGLCATASLQVLLPGQQARFKRVTAYGHEPDPAVAVARMLLDVSEDLVLVWDTSIVPPADTLRQMLKAFRPSASATVVHALTLRDGPDWMRTLLDPQRFSLWANWDVKKALPVTPGSQWDDDLRRGIQQVTGAAVLCGIDKTVGCADMDTAEGLEIAVRLLRGPDKLSRLDALLLKFPDLEMKGDDDHLNDKVCPECGNRDELRIRASSVFTVVGQGTDDHEDVEWDADSFTACPNCQHEGKLQDFTYAGLDDRLDEERS